MSNESILCDEKAGIVSLLFLFMSKRPLKDFFWTKPITANRQKNTFFGRLCETLC